MTKRHAMLSEQKRVFKRVTEAAGLKSRSNRPASTFHLAAAPVAHPGTSQTIAAFAPATLVLVDVDADALGKLRDQLGQQRVLAVPVDVSSEGAMHQLFDQIDREVGALDFVFNNAGIASGGEFQDYTFADWKRLLDVNLWGVIYGSTFAYRCMLVRGTGHIVNVASLGGLIPEPMASAYSASKHAVVGLTCSLREEAHARGVRVSVVCPGVIDTPIFDRATYAGHVDPKAVKQATLAHGAMAASDAAQIICKQVAKNTGIILVNPSDRVFWGLYRASPRALSPLHRYLSQYFREHFELEQPADPERP